MPAPWLALLFEMVLLVTVSMLPSLMPPPVPAELPEMTQLFTVSVLTPVTLMPPPKFVLPFSIVRPEMATLPLTQNTLPTAFPLTAIVDAPGPLMVRFLVIVSAHGPENIIGEVLVRSVMVPVSPGAKTIGVARCCCQYFSAQRTVTADSGVAEVGDYVGGSESG